MLKPKKGVFSRLSISTFCRGGVQRAVFAFRNTPATPIPRQPPIVSNVALWEMPQFPAHFFILESSQRHPE
jgi:hypothetical protein